MGLQTQSMLQVGEDWTRSIWVWLPSLMSLQAFSLEIHPRKLQSPDETGWLQFLLVAHRFQSRVGCAEACWLLLKTAKAALRCKMTASRGLPGDEGEWLEHCRGSAGYGEDRLEESMLTVQGTATTKERWWQGAASAEPPSPMNMCLGSVPSLPEDSAITGHVTVCRASLKMGSCPFCS